MLLKNFNQWPNDGNVNVKIFSFLPSIAHHFVPRKNNHARLLTQLYKAFLTQSDQNTNLLRSTKK